MQRKNLETALMLRLLDNELASAMKTASSQWTWQRLPFVLEAKGSVVNDFIQNAQCKTTRALEKANRAAYSSWTELVIADEAKYEQDALESLGIGWLKKA